METASFSHPLHNFMAFSRIQEGDSYVNWAWKVPAGRILSVAVTLTALVESILASMATVLFAPIYFIHRASFYKIAEEAVDAMKIVVLSTQRFFGLETTKEIARPEFPAKLAKAAQVAKGAKVAKEAKVAKVAKKTKVAKVARTPSARPESVLHPTRQFLTARAADVAHFVHERPKTTLFAVAFGVTVVGAYYFGLFDHLPSLFSRSSATSPVSVLTNVSENLPETHVLPTSLETCPARLMLSDKPFWPSQPSMPTFQPPALPKSISAGMQENPGICPVVSELSKTTFSASPLPNFQPLTLPNPTPTLFQNKTILPRSSFPSTPLRRLFPRRSSLGVVTNSSVNTHSTSPQSTAYQQSNPSNGNLFQPLPQLSPNLLSPLRSGTLTMNPQQFSQTADSPGITAFARKIFADNARKMSEICETVNSYYQPIRKGAEKLQKVTGPIAKWTVYILLPKLLFDIATGR